MSIDPHHASGDKGARKKKKKKKKKTGSRQIDGAARQKPATCLPVASTSPPVSAIPGEAKAAHSRYGESAAQATWPRNLPS